MEKNKVQEIRTLDAIGDAKCYLINTAELLAKIQPTLPPGQKIELKLPIVVALLQAFWDSFKDAARECVGKEVVIPTSGFWSVARTLLSLVGFKL